MRVARSVRALQMNACSSVFALAGPAIRMRPNARAVRHPLEIGLVHGRVATVAGIRLVMQVLVRVRAVHGEGFVGVVVETKNLGDLVIDPDECVIVVFHAAIVACAAPKGIRAIPYCIRNPTNAPPWPATDNARMATISRLAGCARGPVAGLRRDRRG